MRAAAGTVGLWALLNLALTTLLVFGGDLREQFAELSPVVLDQVVLTLRNLGPVSAFLLPFVWWIGVSALLLLAANLFGGNSGFSKVLAIVGAACAPWILGYAVQLPLGMVQHTSGGRRYRFGARGFEPRCLGWRPWSGTWRWLLSG